jgi:hypothetical protein
MPVARYVPKDLPPKNAILPECRIISAAVTLPVAELFPIACGNSRDRRLHRRVLIGTDRKDSQ